MAPISFRPSGIQKINCDGIVFHVDDQGFLLNPSDWNEFVACALAKKEGKKELTPVMLGILYFIRDHYQNENSFPSLSFVARSLEKPTGNVMAIFGNHATAWKIAGLPQPKETLYY